MGTPEPTAPTLQVQAASLAYLPLAPATTSPEGQVPLLQETQVPCSQDPSTGEEGG